MILESSNDHMFAIPRHVCPNQLGRSSRVSIHRVVHSRTLVVEKKTTRLAKTDSS